MAGEHLEQQDPAAVEVAARIGRAVGELLGRQIGRSTQQHRGAEIAGLDRPRQAEVGHFHVAGVGDEYVLRLHVPVDEARGVGSAQTLQNTGQDVEGAGHGQPATPGDLLAQSAARYVLHDEVERVGRAAPVVDGHHMRIGQPGSRAGLGHEPFGEALLVDKVVVHDLDRDDPFEAGIEPLVDRAHAAPGHDPVHVVAAVKDPPAQIGGGTHVFECTYRCRLAQ